MLKVILTAALLTLPMSTAVAANDELGAASEWTPRQPLALPALASNVPSAAAGCVVVGHHVLADGSSARARVLTGAYAGMDAAQQQAFAGSVLEAAANWRFQAANHGQPSAAFRLQTIGLIPARGGTRRVVVGLEALPAQLRDVCQIPDLVAWGEANAVSVEQARAEHRGDNVVVPDPATGARYWVRKDPVQPPRYPPIAIKAGVEACIVVGAVVGIDGQVKTLMILNSDARGAPRRPWTGRGLTRKDAAEVMERSALNFAAEAQFVPGPDNLQRNASFLQWPVTYELGTPRQSGSRMDCEILTADELAKVLESR